MHFDDLHHGHTPPIRRDTPAHAGDFNRDVIAIANKAAEDGDVF